MYYMKPVAAKSYVEYKGIKCTQRSQSIAQLLFGCNVLFLKAYSVMGVKPCSHSGTLAWHCAQANESCSLSENSATAAILHWLFEASVVFTSPAIYTLLHSVM